jgi:hypothetical protein
LRNLGFEDFGILFGFEDFEDLRIYLRIASGGRPIQQFDPEILKS